MAKHTLINTVLLPSDKKKSIGGLLCDPQAFDCVKHDILSAKLEYYGMTSTANKLMSPCLKNQRAVIKDSMLKKLTSEWEPVKCGVPHTYSMEQSPS
jgi:hypothetical protein